MFLPAEVSRFEEVDSTYLGTVWRNSARFTRPGDAFVLRWSENKGTYIGMTARITPFPERPGLLDTRAVRFSRLLGVGLRADCDPHSLGQVLNRNLELLARLRVLEMNRGRRDAHRREAAQEERAPEERHSIADVKVTHGGRNAAGELHEVSSEDERLMPLIRVTACVSGV